MNKDNSAKKWIAFAIAFALVIISLLAGKKTDKAEDIAKDKLMDQYAQDFKSIFDQYQTETIQGSNDKQKIMVVNLAGVIGDGQAYDAIMEDLEKAREDESIKAVIMEVNSPGGAVYNSEQIHNMIEKIKDERKIPVYTVMETLAASGGYYVSVAADKIYASNESLTGSIGVIMSSYSLQGLFEKYGIKEQNITTGAMKDAGSTGKDMTEEQKKYFQALADSAFERFVKVVAEGRNMKEEDVKKLADGRVYDGSQAIKNGLIDEVGDMEKAIKDISKQAKLTDPLVFRRTNYLNSFQSLFSKVNEFKNGSAKLGDLEVLKEFMDQGYPQPMYLYGN
ncbi:MAG: signal peptide peptidase SppA [Peptoniphilaceae bacterium]|nr:signal peptide peptidase SppA [Peptoniphilaceae bacterium]MDY6018802.1 signal peptide peptidase SppA [Anaerococcus sp.]